MPDGRRGRLVIGVTGATGCIGRMLVRHLLRGLSVEVRALVRRGGIQHEPGVSILGGDLFAREPLESLVAGSDVVVHLAARNPTSPEKDRRHVAAFLATNSFGTGVVAHLAEAWGTPVVYTSSVAVYELGGGNSDPFEEDVPLPARHGTASWFQAALGSLTDTIEAWGNGEVEDVHSEVAGFLRETPMPESESIYGLSKLLGERWVAERARGLVLRLSDVYGPGHESRGLLQEYLERVLHGKRVTVDFGPRARVSFVYLGDVLRALLRAVALVRRQGTHVINVAYPTSVTPDQLRDALLSLDGSPPVAVRAPPRTHLPGSGRPFTTERAERLLGMQWTGLREGIHRTLRYLRTPPTEREADQFRDPQL